jgi:tRNA wybutosine-synthesizing protein 4
MSDISTKQSSNDAATCKLSAMRAGYITDEFLHIFSNTHVKKMPIINRGTYARSECISLWTQKFMDLTAAIPAQILIIGCGIDSLALNIKKKSTNPFLQIYEVDFPDVIEYKVQCMKKDDDFLRTIWPHTEVIGETYGSIHLIGGDLRNVETLITSLVRSGCKPDHPTLIISECVLIYLRKDISLSLCFSLASFFQEAMWLTYDMISPDDRFGQVMQQNIATAGYVVPGFFDFPTLESQEQRFYDTAWDSAHSVTMMKAYYGFISAQEQKRVSKVEMFDEVEEWHMLMSHYSLTLALKGSICRCVVDEYTEVIS